MFGARIRAKPLHRSTIRQLSRDLAVDEAADSDGGVGFVFDRHTMSSLFANATIEIFERRAILNLGLARFRAPGERQPIGWGTMCTMRFDCSRASVGERTVGDQCCAISRVSATSGWSARRRGETNCWRANAGDGRKGINVMKAVRQTDIVSRISRRY